MFGGTIMDINVKCVFVFIFFVIFYVSYDCNRCYAKTMPAKKYLIDETVGDTNVKKLGKLGNEYICGVGGDYIWRGIWESQYSNN